LPRGVAQYRRYLWLLLAAGALVFAGTRGFAPRASERGSARTGVGSGDLAHLASQARWVAGWSASPQAAVPRTAFALGFDHQTVRNIVLTSAGGSWARVRFSNAFGRRALRIGRAALGPAGAGAAVVDGRNAPLTFHGRPFVVIPPGGQVLSDSIRLAVRPFERLAVSIYLPGPTGPPTEHRRAKEINYAGRGDQALDGESEGFRTRTISWYFATGIDVWSPARDIGTVVAFGDSITDGVGSRMDANGRWPNDLAWRLAKRHGTTLSVVNAGIGGNRLLEDSQCCGVSALARFGRDVLRQPNVKVVILLEGINDIGRGGNLSAQPIIAGYRQLIARAHAAGVKIFGATLTPFGGSFYWTPTHAAVRDTVNRWIRRSGAFDGVIDFADAVADPRNPEKLRRAYDSGDHLHPNDAGYRAMARAANLHVLLRASRT
jgi:lysophospholipase L1-like esterase